MKIKSILRRCKRDIFKKIKEIVGVKIFTPGLWKLFSLEKG
jgi:hypothetical protein